MATRFNEGLELTPAELEKPNGLQSLLGEEKEVHPVVDEHSALEPDHYVNRDGSAGHVPPKKRNRKKLWLLLAAGLVLVIVVIAIVVPLATRRKSSDQCVVYVIDLVFED